MAHASATALFEHSVYADDLKSVSERLGCAARGVSSKDWSREDPPAEALIYMGGAGSRFSTCAEQACVEAKASGHRFAGLSFNGELPIAPVGAGTDPIRWAAELWERQEALSQASYAAYEKTAEYAESQLRHDQRANRARMDETAGFESTIALLDRGGPSLDVNPAFYKALGSWVEATDHVAADPGGVHRKILLGRLLRAGFVDGEGVDVPSVMDKSDMRAVGRYYVGQALNMGLSTGGLGGGAIHPLIGEWMGKHAVDPGLHSIWRAIQERGDLDESTAPGFPAAKKPRV